MRNWIAFADRPTGPNATATPGKAAELRYGKIPGLEKELAAAVEKTGAAPGQDVMLQEEVGPDDVAEVVSAWTGVPAGDARRRERQAAADGR